MNTKEKVNYRPVLKISEAANILNICQTTIRRMIKRGELEHFKVAGAYRIYADQLPNYEKPNK